METLERQARAYDPRPLPVGSIAAGVQIINEARDNGYEPPRGATYEEELRGARGHLARLQHVRAHGVACECDAFGDRRST